MDPFAPGQQREIIDLESDSEEESNQAIGVDSDSESYEASIANELGYAHGPDNAIDLTALEDLPDIDVPPDPLSPLIAAQPGLSDDNGELLSETQYLQMVLNVLPDVSIDHVLTLIQERTQPRTHQECERLITSLLDGGTYPKENDEANKRKRKRGDDDDSDITAYENGEHNIDLPDYRTNAITLLGDEFLHLPARHIENTLLEHKTFFKAYGVLEDQLRNHDRVSSPFSKLKRSRNKRGIEWTLIASASPLPKELKAAKKKSEMMAETRRKKKEAERAEEDNIRQAQERDEMDECKCCYGEFPRNRMTYCNGDSTHFFCLACAKTYVEGEMGNARCRPVCFADTSCGGTFARSHLLRFLGQTSFDRLEHLQQQADLAAAGLDFLDDCPFCDFKAECLPVEIDREFRCLNPKCERTSCRLCQKETHIPLSCEEAKKDGNLTIRHVIEEAMSAALIRHCNRCKHPFVKEHGCNKMSCSHCQNVQCYVCSKDVTNYEHFGEARGPGNATRCPLHDNVEARHEEEVKKAAADALAKVRAENPHISEAELMIQVSDRVKEAEQNRMSRAGAERLGFPFHMVGNQLAQVPAGPGLFAGPGQVPAPRAMIYPHLRRPAQMPGGPHMPHQPYPRIPIHGVPAQYHIPFNVQAPPRAPGLPQFLGIPQMPHHAVPAGAIPPRNLRVWYPPLDPGQINYLPRNHHPPRGRPH